MLKLIILRNFLPILFLIPKYHSLSRFISFDHPLSLNDYCTIKAVKHASELNSESLFFILGSNILIDKHEIESFK